MKNNSTFNIRPSKFQSGQALVMLLIFIAIAVTISSAAVVILISNSQTITSTQEGQITYAVAEAGVENALLRLLRDPGYTGETFTLNDIEVTTTVTGTTTKTVIAQAKGDNFIRRLEVVATYNAGLIAISSWKEVP